MARRLGCSIYLPVSGSVSHFSKETEATDHRPVTPTKKRGLRRRRMIDNVEDKVLAGTGRDSCSISVASRS